MVWIAYQNKQKILIFTNVCIFAVFLILILRFNLDAWSTHQEYKNIVFKGESPYGSLIVTQSDGQYNFIENGIPFFSTQNIEQIEESVHYPMSQRPEAREVLILGGGVAGTAREILKYPSAQVDYVELDPLILHAAELFVPENFKNSRIHLFESDGRLFVQNSKNKYDIIILGSPEPVSFQFNRFYTQEFFQAVKRAMKLDGVFSFSISGYQNYMDQRLSDLIAATYSTLKSVFKNVFMIPGYKTYFLASDGELTFDIIPSLRSQNISVKLINENYPRTILTSDRLADLQRAAAQESFMNTDFNPVLYFYHLKYWMSRFQSHLFLWGALLLLPLIFYIRKLNAISFAVFSTGFTSSALEMILLCGFQILYGNVYYRMGIMITAFMLGMSLGSFFAYKNLLKMNLKQLISLMTFLAIYAFLVPLILKMFGALQLQNWTFFTLLIFLPAFLSGIIFTLTAKLLPSSNSPASSIYAADYIGACLGFLFLTTILLPLLGIKVVCALIALLCAGSALALSGKLVKQKI